MEHEIKVAYADDHNAVRKGIVLELNLDPQINIIVEGKNGADLLDKILCSPELPDVCLIDLNMPVMDGFTLLKEIRKRWPEMGCLVYTSFEVEYYIIQMIKAGANGYLTKNCDVEEIYNAIKTVHTYGYYYCETASEKTFETVKDKGYKRVILNKREIGLLKSICSEQSYPDMAISMNMSFKTLKGIISRLGIKLGVSNRVSFVLAAIQFGYFDINDQKIVSNNNII